VEGNKRQAVDITADSVVPVVRDGAASNGGGSNGYAARSDVPVDTSDYAMAPSGGGGSSSSASDDDIPF